MNVFWHIARNGGLVFSAVIFCMLLAAFYEWAKPETWLERAAAPFVFLYAFGWVFCTTLWRAYFALKAQYAKRKAIRRYYAPTKGTLDEFYGDWRP
jgi:hypothetical protein